MFWILSDINLFIEALSGRGEGEKAHLLAVFTLLGTPVHGEVPTSVDLTLGRRRRRWPSGKSTLCRCVVSAGDQVGFSRALKSGRRRRHAPVTSRWQRQIGGQWPVATGHRSALLSRTVHITGARGIQGFLFPGTGDHNFWYCHSLSVGVYPSLVPCLRLSSRWPLMSTCCRHY